MATDGVNIKLALNPQMDTKGLQLILKTLQTGFSALAKNLDTKGVKKLENEWEKINNETKEYSNNLKSADSQVNKLAADTSKLSKATASVSVGGATGGAFAFNQMAQSLTMATASLNQFLTPFIQLDKEIKNIGTLGRDNFEEFAALTSRLAAKIPGDAATIARGTYQAISAMGERAAEFTNKQIINFVEVAAKAGVAGKSTTDAAVDGITSILNAYGLGLNKADEVSNTFFASIKLGKTTFDELNAAIPAVVPSAAAAGVGFDQLGAALSSMTAKGIPTVQAATQLNAVFTLLSKGNTLLEIALAKSGLSNKRTRRSGRWSY